MGQIQLPLPCPLTRVRCQLAHHLHVPVLAFQIVDGAHVVQAATSHEVPRGRVGASHHPRRLERDGVYLGTHRAEEESAGAPRQNSC